MTQRLSYYPIRVGPRKAIWDVDHIVRKHAGIPSIRPPTEPTWRKTSKGKKVERPRAIIHSTCYFGFESWDDYHRMRKVSDHFDLGIQQILGMERDTPYILTSADIACIKLLDEQGSGRAATRVHATLKIGDACTVSEHYKGGALSGLTAVFRSIDGNDVEIDTVIFNALRRVTVPAWAIEPV